MAEALGEHLPKAVFVGGAVAALYDDSPAADVRPTDDIDCVAEVNVAGYYALLTELKSRGFRESRAKGAPVCRLTLGADLAVDVMATDPAVLEFSNRWFADGIMTARLRHLPGGLTVRAITPLYFVATKLEAFKGRGAADVRSSHDLEDVLVLLARRPALLEEIGLRAGPLGEYLRQELRSLSRSEDLLDAIPGAFRGDPEGQLLARELTSAFLRLRAG
ncbi:MAG: hypothetical protein ACYC8T_02870 [Myxococcaceae bacterium]